MLYKRLFRIDALLNIYFIILIIGIIVQFIEQIRYGDHQVAWNLSEWLVNYQGGFVRRGLRGEVIYQLYTHFAIEPYTSIRVITVSSYILLTIFFVRSFVKKGYSLFILPCVFFLGNPILNGFWLRLDSVLCLLIIGITYFLTKKNKFNLLWVNILLIIGLLLHEIIIFITIPIVILFLINQKRNSNNNENKPSINLLFFSCISLLPVIIVFFLVFIFNGSEPIVAKIWQSWGPTPFSFDFSREIHGNDYPGALQAITFNFKEGLKLSKEGLIFFSNGIYNPIAVLFSILGTFYVLSNINFLEFRTLSFYPKNNDNKNLIGKVLFFQFCTTIPLYFLGYDYGRWIFLWVISSFILLLIIPEKQLEFTIPDFFGSLATKLNNLLGNLLGNTQKSIIIIASIIGFSTTLWFFKKSVETTSLYVILGTISSFVRKVFMLFNWDFFWA